MNKDNEASKPAAIDKQGPVAWMTLDCVHLKPCDVYLDKTEVEGMRPEHVVPLYAAPLATEASEPVAIVAHTPGCGDGEDCHACANLDRSLYAASLAAPSVEQDERAAHVSHYIGGRMVCNVEVPEGFSVKCESEGGGISRVIVSAAPSDTAPHDGRAALDVSVLARLSAQIFDCPLNPTISKFARAVEANIRAATTSANVAQGAEVVAYQGKDRDGNWSEFTKEMFDMAGGDSNPSVRKLYAAPPAQTALTGRVLTYRNQPDNIGAWRLGEACRRAADLPAGDYIDRGLGLLKELQAKGFGVIALTAAQSASGDTK